MIDYKLLVDRLDFELIQAYMILTKWTYSGEEKSPSIDQLKDVAYYVVGLVEQSILKNRNRNTFYSTGGFKASYSASTKQVNIEFIIASRYISTN